MRQAVTSGANPIAIKKGIDKTCEFLIQKLRENAKPVQGTQDIKVQPRPDPHRAESVNKSSIIHKTKQCKHVALLPLVPPAI